MKTIHTLNGALLLCLCLSRFPAGVAAQGMADADLPRNGLDLWLRADALENLTDGEGVGEWPTKHGGQAGAHAVQAIAERRPRFVANHPALGGRPALRFDGENDYLHLPDLSIGAEATAFFVVEAALQTSGGSVWRSVLSGDSDAYRADTTKYAFSFLHREKPLRFYASLYHAERRSGRAETPILTPADGAFHLFTFRRDDAVADGMTLAVDGTPAGTATVPEDAPGFPGTGYTIGQGGSIAGGGSGARFYRGHIAEILVYNRALSEIERMRVEDYLGTKYRLCTRAAPPARGMQLWLRTEALEHLQTGDGVGHWPDSSGREHHAVQPVPARQPSVAAPGPTGLPALRFAPGTSLALPPLSIGGTYTAVLVYRDPDPQWTPVFLHDPNGAPALADSLTISQVRLDTVAYRVAAGTGFAATVLAAPESGPETGLLELILYDRDLSGDEQSRLERYLKLRHSRNTDPRRFANGHLVYRNGYCDQPYIAKPHDGAWLMVITTSRDREGGTDQHMVFSRSTDQGRTWSDVWNSLELDEGRRPSWGTLYVTSFGRVYCFYNLEPLEGRGILYCFRYSDDGGRNWSTRAQLPLRETFHNHEYEDAHSWGIDPPERIGDVVYWGFTRFGGPEKRGEGFVFRSPNLDTETDPARLKFEMLPEGDHGVYSDRVGLLREEHNVVGLSDGSLVMYFRTLQGYLAEAYSHDAGHTWTEPDFARYGLGGRRIKQTRACPRVWRLENGRFLLWYHHNDGRRTLERNKDRNPAWLSAGTEIDGRIVWSEPEVLLYGRNFPYDAGMSYPSLVEDEGRYVLATTEKREVRVFEPDPDLITALLDQQNARGTTAGGLILDLNGRQILSPGAALPRVELPDLLFGGFTLDLGLQVRSFDTGGVLLDARDEQGQGWAVHLDPDRSLRLSMKGTGHKTFEWSTDPGLLETNRVHRVAFVVDGQADLLIPVVDGKVCDGAEARQFGWAWFPEELIDVGHESITVGTTAAADLLSLLVYDRRLRVSEVVGNHASGQATTAPARTRGLP